MGGLMLDELDSNVEQVRPGPTPVLLLEDEAGMRSVLSAVLQEYGFRVFQASTGHAALEFARKNRPEAFLLDIDLPDLDAIEVCKTIRNIPAHRVTPILF